MIHDQADNLRQLVRRRSETLALGPVAKLIVVAGGKGGVGASTMAANLAMALAAQGRRTVLVEADLDHTAVGMASHTESGSIIDALSGRRTVHEILERGPGGIQVLPGAWAPAEVVECSAKAQQRFIAELKNLGRHADAAVVDVGSTRNHFARRFWQAADLVLLVTTPEPAAIMESYAAIKVLIGADTEVPVYTLVNRVDNAESAAEIHARIGGACRRFLGLVTYEAGCVPLEPSADSIQAADRAHMLLLQSPRSDAARSLEEVAELVWAAVTSIHMDRSGAAGIRNQTSRAAS